MSNLPSILSSCGCCSCGPAKYRYRTRSISITKCGHPEFVSPSTPPKIYRTKTQSGSVDQIYSGPMPGGGGTRTTTWSGFETYDRISCGINDTRAVRIQDSQYSCDVTFTSSAGYLSAIADRIDVVYQNYCYVYGGFSGLACTTNQYNQATTPVISQTSQGTNGMSSGFSGLATVALSDEYTDQNLKDDADTLIASASWGAWSSFYNFTDPLTSDATAFGNTSSDGMTITLKEVNIQLYFPMPGNGSCMRQGYRESANGGISDEVFVEWDKTVPSGYDPADPSTWWNAFDYVMTRPSFNGDRKLIPTSIICDSGCT